MIKANEFRIDNFVIDEDGYVRKIKGIDSSWGITMYKLTTKNCNVSCDLKWWQNSGFKPISLTEEWLKERYIIKIEDKGIMNRIKEILESKGVKQTWLAEKLGKSYNMVNSYIQNRRQPSIETLFKIANILEVKPSELIKNNK